VSAASLALSAITPRCLVFELKPIENPVQHELVDRPFVQNGGWIDVPTSPGLGIDVIEHVVEKYRF
jgi:L-alanine-DL-glutamate epimerase-like enolase superfamily enzyme